jgi:hypothetical protein
MKDSECQPGLSLDEIAKLEADLKIALPGEVRDLLAFINGGYFLRRAVYLCGYTGSKGSPVAFVGLQRETLLERAESVISENDLVLGGDTAGDLILLRAASADSLATVRYALYSKEESRALFEGESLGEILEKEFAEWGVFAEGNSAAFRPTS